MRSSPHCSAQWAQLLPPGLRVPRHAEDHALLPGNRRSPPPRIPDVPQGKAMPLRIIARSAYSATSIPVESWFFRTLRVDDQAACRTRPRKSSNPALPYIARFSILIQLI